MVSVDVGQADWLSLPLLLVVRTRFSTKWRITVSAERCAAASLGEVLAVRIATDPVQHSGLVFPSTRGYPLRRSHFRDVWRRACTAAGFDGGPLDGLSFHELRHTAAALAIAQGAHPVAIKERLGHSSITVPLSLKMAPDLRLRRCRRAEVAETRLAYQALVGDRSVNPTVVRVTRRV